MPFNSVTPHGRIDSSLRKAVLRRQPGWVVITVQQCWNRIQISRLGQYSAERTQALDEYCQQTSLSRVVLVSLLTPCPALFIAISIECIPLQNPADGWKANYGVWIRSCCFIIIAASGSLLQVRSSAPGLSYRKIFLIGLATGCFSTLAMVGLSAMWTFPVPFGIAFMSFPFQILLTTFFLASMRSPGSFIPHISVALKHKIYLVVAQSGMAFAYILFTIAFARCTSKQQFGLLFFLPVMKLVFKHFVARLDGDDIETVPAVVVFTVDALNGFYTSVCIQTTRSWWSSLLMIAFNMAHTTISFREVEKNTKVIEVLNCRNYDNQAIVQVLKKHRHRQRPSMSLLRQFDSERVHSVRQYSQEPSPTVADYQLELDHRSRKMLFHLEYLVLVKYTESIIPTLYAIYQFVLFHLPTAKYYPHTRSLTFDQLLVDVGSIIAYVLAQVLFLVWLHVTLKRRFGFSLLCQLAFVLENEIELIQSRLTVWIAPMLEFTLAHFGRMQFRKKVLLIILTTVVFTSFRCRFQPPLRVAASNCDRVTSMRIYGSSVPRLAITGRAMESIAAAYASSSDDSASEEEVESTAQDQATADGEGQVGDKRKRLDEPQWTRAFPHVVGNWPSHVRIDIPVNQELRDLIKDTINRTQEIVGDAATLVPFKEFEDEAEEGLHLSLSRPFVLTYDQIATFVDTLRAALVRCRRFRVTLGCVMVLVNDAKTRSFLALRVDKGGQHVNQLLQSVDRCLERFNQPVYYKDPIPHVSIASSIGEELAQLTSDHFESLTPQQEKLQQTATPNCLTASVTAVHVVIGNKHYDLPLSPFFIASS